VALILFQLAWRGAFRSARRATLTILASGGAMFILAFINSLADGYLAQRLEAGLSTYLGQGTIRPDARPIADGAALAKLLCQDPEVVAAAPRIRFSAMLKGRANSAGAVVLGVDAGAESEATDLPSKLEAGSFLTDSGSADAMSIVLGAGLAQRLGVHAGDGLAVIAAGRDGILCAEPALVCGVFRSLQSTPDSSFCYIDRRRAVQMVAPEGDAHEIVLRLRDPWQAQETMHRLSESPACQGLRAESWETTAPELTGAVAYFRAAERMRSAFVFLLAGLTLLNTLTFSIVERRREFGAFLAVGMRPRQIAATLVAESAFLVCTGLVLAFAALAVVTRGWLSRSGIDITHLAPSLPGALEGATRLYPMLDLAGAARAAGVVMWLWITAILFPIWRVLRLEAADALRD
jgi:lipoprotein-releasing system permease protein